ncbi:hypothetical protein HGRIS_000558 [Hohenbuehelia grisea]|uniref:Ribosome recycling factor domain-containing protein n=1 Tax=Hohenbuehelia grisea TaxID=104357 RepID=A0ABR3JSB4_9AGAR
MSAVHRTSRLLGSCWPTPAQFCFRRGLTRYTRYTSSPLFVWPPKAPMASRAYATKGKGKAKSTSTLVPGSQQPLTSGPAREEYTRAEEKMHAAVEWFRKEAAAVESRGTGRVTPAVLDPVRVTLPDTNASVKLDQVATVGVREGNNLLVTLFEEQNMKHVEQAIYAAKIPSIVPQKLDDRTIKIPIPRVTLETITALYTAMQRKAEDTRMQIRKQHQASIKRGKFEKHSIEVEVFQKLTDRHIAEIDAALLPLKKLASRR